MKQKLLVDVHSHLDMETLYSRREEIITQAIEKGVSHIITNGIDMKTNRLALDLAEEFSIVHAACGIYPQTFTDTFTKQDLTLECDFIEEHKKEIIAIGEIGLDKKEDINYDDQEYIFRTMLSLAQKLKKTVIVHTRKAEEEVLTILDDYNLPAVILHCFSGKKRLIRRAQQKGYYFSVPANIVRATHFQELVRLVPLHQLLTETDAPFLSPFHGKENEPANVSEAIPVIANLQGMTVEETIQNIYFNYQKIF
jgi:TatD DNase family protein